MNVLIFIYRFISAIVIVFIVLPLFILREFVSMLMDFPNMLVYYNFENLDNVISPEISDILFKIVPYRFLQKLIYCVIMPIGGFIQNVINGIKSIKF